MNWVDLAAIGVLAISALLAFMRGFVREVLGIAAWLGAGLFAASCFHFVQGRFRLWIENPDIADPVAFAVLFIAALLAFSLIANAISGIARMSFLSGIDRTLGMVFGLARGAALVAFAYIVLGLLTPPDRWPDPVLQARFLPLAYEGAAWGVNLLPTDYRPRIYPPPEGRPTTSADLLRAEPRPTAHAGDIGR